MCLDNFIDLNYYYLYCLHDLISKDFNRVTGQLSRSFFVLYTLLKSGYKIFLGSVVESKISEYLIHFYA